MANPIYRRATPADSPVVTALLHAYFTEFDIWQRDDDAHVAQSLAPSADGAGYFLAFTEQPASSTPRRTPAHGTVPVAIVQLRPLSLPSLPSRETAVECKRLYVLPAFRGQKLASGLMDAAEQTARSSGHTWVYLDSKADFTAAIDLYRSRGYEEIPRFNDNPQATIFMRKQLSM